MKRHRYDTDEWAEAVIARYYRRRDLPRRQLVAAWNDILEQTIAPIVRWLASRIA